MDERRVDKHLKAGQDDPWIFYGCFDFAQEHDRLTAINQTMVVSERHVHHGTDHNLKGEYNVNIIHLI